MALTGPDSGEGRVLGGDIGGTSTRIAVADLSGRVVARAQGPGGNPVSHPDTARAVFAAVLTDVLVGLEPGAVRSGVIGMAGSGALADEAVRAGYDRAWRDAGLAGAPEICSDVEVAFAAGTEASDGSVLIAGTGAVAGRVRGHRLVATVGGHGWLLGDEGAGFWIGREAVRSTLCALEGTGPVGPMTEAVLRELGVSGAGGGARTGVIAAVHARPPVALSVLAPLVAEADRAGDGGATTILDTAVRHLLDLWEGLPEGAAGDPVVLAGSLTAPGTRVGAGLRSALAERGVSSCTAGDPVEGAVRVALRRLDRI